MIKVYRPSDNGFVGDGPYVNLTIVPYKIYQYQCIFKHGSRTQTYLGRVGERD